MEALMGYSPGRIQFIPTDRGLGEREYSDRSLIQLIEVEFPNAILRALDVENNKQKIFDIPLNKEDQYKYGNSKDDPDEVRSNDGTYRLWLNNASREIFYKELRKYFLQRGLFNEPVEDSHKRQRKNDSGDNRGHKIVGNNDNYGKPVEPVKPTSTIVSPKDLLLDVHLLSQYIEKGDGKEAARIASQLISQGVRLRVKPSNSAPNEREFTIQVRLDGNEYAVDQHGAQIPIDVFQSTTVRELRAAFELAYQYPPTNQYFFVNGCLAHDDSTMKELDVGPNSLFILFLLKYSKKTGPWKCSACQTNNQSHNLRCTACLATRQN